VVGAGVPGKELREPCRQPSGKKIKSKERLKNKRVMFKLDQAAEGGISRGVAGTAWGKGPSDPKEHHVLVEIKKKSPVIDAHDWDST